MLLSRESHLPESALHSAEENGIEIVEIPALADAGDWIYSFRLQIRLRGLLREWGTDLVHTHYPAAVRPALQCLKALPDVAAVHSLYLDPESLGAGWFHRYWVRAALRRRLAATRRVIVRHVEEETLVRALHVAKPYQLERIPLSVDVEAIRDLAPKDGPLEPFQASAPTARVGLFIPDVAQGPFRRTLFSLRSLFDFSKEVTVWCVVPAGQVREVEKTSRRLRFPENFHIVGGILAWEWAGTAVRAAWIPGRDADSDVAAAISSAVGIPVFRSASLKMPGAVLLGEQYRPVGAMDALREIPSDPAKPRMIAPEPVLREEVQETAERLSRCYYDVLRESRGGTAPKAPAASS
jgi:hypothetical protein